MVSHQVISMEQLKNLGKTTSKWLTYTWVTCPHLVET